MNNALKIKWIALLTAISIYPASSLAGFEVIDEPIQAPVIKKEIKKDPTPPAVDRAVLKKAEVAKIAIKPSVVIGGITHTGRKPSILPPARGFGNDVTLRESIMMLLPESFSVYNDGNIDLNQKASWAAADADDWAGVLGNVFRKAGVAATLDWGKNSLTLDRHIKVAEPPAPKPKWILEAKDKTVRAALHRWARQAGWHLDWDVAVDYPIPYDVTYEGQFESAVGEVMGSLAGSDFPVQACTYENKTLRVVRFGETQRCNLQK